VITLLLACTPEPPPAAPPAAVDPFAGCPTLDWVVHLSSELPIEVHSVEALPGGDVVVAGRYGGSPAIGLGPDQTLQPSQDYRDGFLARLRPDGHAVWWHTIGGVSMDELPHLTWDGGDAWLFVAGRSRVIAIEPYSSLQLDRVDVVPPAPAGVSEVFWLVGFDLDGEVQVVRAVNVEHGGTGLGIAGTQDPAGNTYLAGHFRYGALSFGPWHVAPDYGDGPSQGYAFLASWDKDGAPRWFTTLGAPEVLSESLGLSYADGLLQWAAQVRSPEGRATATSTLGPRTRIELGDQLGTILAADAATGEVLPPRYRTNANRIYRYERQPGGALVANGFMTNPAWWDAGGTKHELSGIGGFAAELAPDGAIEGAVSPEDALKTFWSRTGSHRTISTALVSGLPIAQGTPQEFLIPGTLERDAVAFVDDPSGVLECASWFSGPENQDAFDAVLDDQGGYVVVGAFEGVMTVNQPDGAVSEPFTSAGYTDGFIAHFSVPE
jgi:hypothetical protein